MDPPRSTDGHDGERGQDRRWRRLGSPVVVLLGLAVMVWLAAGALGHAGTATDADRATAIARDFFDGAHGSGASVANVRILSVALGSDSAGHPAWKVNIGGDVTEVGASSASYSSYMWLDVDAGSGAVTLVAQG